MSGGYGVFVWIKLPAKKSTGLEHFYLKERMRWDLCGVSARYGLSSKIPNQMEANYHNAYGQKTGLQLIITVFPTCKSYKQLTDGAHRIQIHKFEATKCFRDFEKLIYLGL